MSAQSDDGPSFRLPAEGGLSADRSLVLPVEIPATPVVIDVDPAIEAANALYDELADGEWEIDQVVARIGNDPEAAFAFVRDRIAFQPYPGVLRGAAGTLAARAGNAYDRALLLKALLEAQGQTTRLAFADLDAGAAVQLAERVQAPVPEPLQSAGDLVLGADLRESIEKRARRDYALLRPMLDTYLTATSVVPLVDPATVVTRHAWVQVQDGDAWVDYDPSLLAAQPGDVLVAPASFADEVPASDRQAVTLRVVTEALADGVLSEAPVLELRLDAADAAGRQILLAFQPGSGEGGLLGSVGTSTGFTPLLIVDGAATVGAPFDIEPAEDAGGGFADFGGLVGGSTGELAGLYLDVVQSMPGQADETHRRVLLDRVPAEARQTGNVTPDTLEPLAADESGPLVLAGVHHVMVSTGASDPLTHASARAHSAYLAATDLAAPGAAATFPIDVVLWPMTVVDDALVVISEHAIVDSVSGSGVMAFVGRPRIDVVSLVPDPAAPLGLSYTIDIMVDPLEVLAPGDAGPLAAARTRVWYGTLQSALETEQAIRLAPAFGAGQDNLDSVSLRLDEEGAAPGVASPDTQGGDVPTSMREALAAGLIVITPDPASPDAWWTVDPLDGATRSILGPGLDPARIAGPRGGGAATTTPVSGASSNMSKPDTGPKGYSTKDMFEEGESHGNLEAQLVTDEVAVETVAKTSWWGKNQELVIGGLILAAMAVAYAYRK